VQPEVKPFRVVDATRATRWKTCIPVVPMSIAAGGFSTDQDSLFDESAADWVEWDGMPTPQHGMFVAKITGDSMEPKVPAGSWCLFKPYGGGSRNGRDLVVSNQQLSEAGFPVGLTLKRYRSEKVVDPSTGELRHVRILLEPLNPKYQAIEIAAEETDEGATQVRIVAELDCVITAL
jgi:SOS-response transcriptional repressor LexA